MCFTKLKAAPVHEHRNGCHVKKAEPTFLRQLPSLEVAVLVHDTYLGKGYSYFIEHPSSFHQRSKFFLLLAFGLALCMER